MPTPGATLPRPQRQLTPAEQAAATRAALETRRQADIARRNSGGAPLPPCRTKPAAWWLTGNPGNPMARYLCNTACPRLDVCQDETSRAHRDGQPPYGLIQAGWPHNIGTGDPVQACVDGCGRPVRIDATGCETRRCPHCSKRHQLAKVHRYQAAKLAAAEQAAVEAAAGVAA